MLPRSCLRLALSKSNSSTRLPRRTTTRVSSGWVASISILLDIEFSHGPRRRGIRRRPVPARRATDGAAERYDVRGIGRCDQARAVIQFAERAAHIKTG